MAARRQGNGFRAAQALTAAAVMLLCIWLLWQSLDPAALRGVGGAFARLSPDRFAAAVLLGAISYWAIGRYDSVAHRHIGTGIDDAQARLSGTIAIALAQTLGCGTLTGAVVRWRMLPGLGLPAAMRLSAFVSLSFLAGWAVLTALACVVLTAPDHARLPAAAVLLACPLLIWLLFSHPHVAFGRHRIALPNLTACAAILLWTSIDAVAAAAALFVLLPDAGVTFGVFLPAFLLALGAALVSGTPGGVGPFDLVIFGLLHQAPQDQVLAALLVYRLLYFALPAVLAAAALLRPLAYRRPFTTQTTVSLHHAPRAEAGVIRQNGGYLIGYPGGAAAVWPTPQTMTALFDPLDGDAAALIAPLRDLARSRNRIACLYKAGARSALVARAAGWSVIRIAEEAVLHPHRFTLDDPRRRSLRRKLRQAAKAGISVTQTRLLPLTAMARIDTDWSSRNGGARAGTMGCFCPDYLGQQQVYLAWQGPRLIAFASFHRTDREWCLDLMRSVGDMPDGTMHALIHHAIEQAAVSGLSRLSLAAVPACLPRFRTGAGLLMCLVAARLARRSNGPGLRQFKSAFAPHWQPLYAAAPQRIALALALADIARCVHRPRTPPRPAATDPLPTPDKEVARLPAS